MTDGKNQFDEVSRMIQSGETISVFEYLAEHFRKSKQYPQLFEILKAGIRHSLDLPILFDQVPDQLDDDRQRQLEDRLLDACREVGMLLLADGKISQGWRDLQPLSDQQQVKVAVESIDLNEENMNEVIDIALFQGAAPEFGFGLLLDSQGTCNAITFFDSNAAFANKVIRKKLAGKLVYHIYNELRASVCRCVRQANQSADESKSLRSLIAKHEWMFDSCGHHLDVTHLAAAVRIARNCEETPELEMALELCEYGQHLDPQLQYPGETPFEQTYDDHRTYFQVLLGIEAQKLIEHFRRKISASKSPECRFAAQAVVIDLLANSGQSAAAVSEAIALDQTSETGIELISLMQLANNVDDFQSIMQHCESKLDLLGFSLSGISGIHQNSKKPGHGDRAS